MEKQSTHHPMNILLAFDGSEHAQSALALLQDLCANENTRRKSKVTLLTIITPRQTADHAYLQQALETARARLENKCFQVTAELILGYPAEKIIEYADSINPDMIMVGAKGLRATLRILLGGVAQQIVEYACCPVMVVRAPYKSIRRVLLVTDGSNYSDRAVTYLMKLPLPPETNVTVMHVLPPPPLRPMPDSIGETWPLGPVIIPPSIPETEMDPSKWQDEEISKGEELLEKNLASLKDAGIDAESILKRGDAATEIIDYIDTEDIDLVIAGSRGLSQVQGWLLGSVSRKLVHYANCSLLIVKQDPD